MHAAGLLSTISQGVATEKCGFLTLDCFACLYFIFTNDFLPLNLLLSQNLPRVKHYCNYYDKCALILQLNITAKHGRT